MLKHVKIHYGMTGIIKSFIRHCSLQGSTAWLVQALEMLSRKRQTIQRLWQHVFYVRFTG